MFALQECLPRFMVLPLYNYLGIGLFADIEELPQQLRHFRIQDSQCTCCSQNHKNPDTGKDMP